MRAERSVTFRYGLVLVLFALTLGLSRLLAYLDLKISLTILVVLALVAAAWYAGRVPGLLLAALFQGATILLSPISAGTPVAAYIFSHFSVLSLQAFIVLMITSRKRVEQKLRASKELYRLLFDRNPHPAWVIDSETLMFLAVNEQSIRRYGYSHEEFLKLSMNDIRPLDSDGDMTDHDLELTMDGSGLFRARHRTFDGSIMDVEVATQPISFHGRPAVIALVTDITEKLRTKRQLLHDAFHDGLTGLPNRTLFLKHLHLAMERSRREATGCAVLYLDCDRFKLFNDSMGHEAGDQLLRQISKRFQAAMRPGDLIARFEGDEFTILLDNLDAENGALKMADLMHEATREPFVLGGNELVVSVTIGISIGGAGQQSGEEMIREAAIAMSAAKAKGPGQTQVYNADAHRSAGRRLIIETEMRAALERGEFELHYQPIVNLRTGGLAAFESLIRWRHPARGLISPAEFIPVAEENGFIVQLGQWTIEESCRQLREWQDTYASARSLSMSVNLSCKQFLEPDLVDKLEAAFSSTGLDPGFLKLEITESHIMENSELAVSLLEQLHLLGSELCLDDFGTGYSSLSYLHRLPVNYLKIDRSFVGSMTENPVNSEIVQTVISLAKSLRLRVVAEGVETEEQLYRLAELGCDFGQGYFLSRPLPPEKAALAIEQETTPWRRYSDQAAITNSCALLRSILLPPAKVPNLTPAG